MLYRLFILSVVLGGAALICRADAAEYLVSSWTGDKLSRFSSSGTFIADLTGATLNGPQAIVKGPDGNVYVADELNNRIVRYNGTTLSFLDAFVASGSGGLNAPCGMTFDSAGNLLAGSFNTDSILKYQAGTGTFLGVLVGPGAGGLNGPDSGTQIGPDGLLYVPSFWNNQVLRYNATSGAFVDAFIPTGSGGLTGPRHLLWKGSHVYVSSESGNRVLRYNSTTGAFVDTFVATGSGGLSGAVGMVFDENNDLLVTSGNNNRVLRYSGVNGAFMGEFIGSASGLGTPTFIMALPTTVPEPASLAIFSLGATWLAFRRKARRSQ